MSDEEPRRCSDCVNADRCRWAQEDFDAERECIFSPPRWAQKEGER